MVMAVMMALIYVSVPALADSQPAKTYNYVAFGDSISSGFGLAQTKNLATDPALILTENLIANPIKGAYPMVFGEMLAGLGAEKGVPVKATNLSMTAYRAQDVSKVILEKDAVGGIAAWIIETFTGEGASAPLSAYHDIVEQYLPEADMVSIMLGGNDIAMGALEPMLSMNNPVLNAVGLSLALTLFGYDGKTAIGGGLLQLQNDMDRINKDSILEAVGYFKETAAKADSLVQNAADEVEDVIKAVKTVNSEADIALIGMFNPYGSSLEYEGRNRDFVTVLISILANAINETQGLNIDVDALLDDIESSRNELIDEEADSDAYQQAMAGLAEPLAGAGEDGSRNGAVTEILQKLWSIVLREISYPLQFFTAGKNSDPQMRELNRKLVDLADQYGLTYVDTYGISNECNLDPHPDLNGHREIAELLYKSMSGIASAKLDKMAGDIPKPAEKVSLDKSGVSVLAGMTAQLKATVSPSNTALTWKSGNTKIATVSKTGLVTAKAPGTVTIQVKTANGASASCKVKVTYRSVYQCKKDGVYRYSTNATTVSNLKSEGWTCKKTFRVPGLSKTKVYWVYDKTMDRYRYTTNLSYARKQKEAGNKCGLAFYSDASKTLPVYELRKGTKRVGYFYTSSQAVRDKMVKDGWQYVHVAWYAFADAA